MKFFDRGMNYRHSCSNKRIKSKSFNRYITYLLSFYTFFFPRESKWVFQMSMMIAFLAFRSVAASAYHKIQFHSPKTDLGPRQSASDRANRLLQWVAANWINRVTKRSEVRILDPLVTRGRRQSDVIRFVTRPDLIRP